MKNSLFQKARKHSTKNDTVHLQRRVGLFSGVALIVGTMIGNKMSKYIDRFVWYRYERHVNVGQ